MVNTDSGPEQFINVKRLVKSFKTGGIRIDVLNDLNITIDSGETIAVVGASGIGKSTLLHILGTLDYPDKGSVVFNGEDVFQFDDSKLAKFRNESIGFIFQFHHLLPEFSAVENTMMPALIKGKKMGFAKELAEAILVRVGLEDRLHHRVSDLSGGEQQRVALARAIVLRPTLLLADEPTGNLDKKNSEQIHELLLELNNEYSMTMVVVTHNMDLSSIMSRRVTIIDGQIAEVS